MSAPYQNNNYPMQDNHQQEYPPQYQQNQYQQNQYQQNQYQENQYQQNQPNQHNQSGVLPQGPPPNSQYGYQPPPPIKATFNETFAVEKPKYHDWWAGVLLILAFLGFVAVSVLTLRRYSNTGSFRGGGIYDGAQSVGLNTNTLVLFMFVLIVGLVFSLAYLQMTRIFTKQIIWITGILNVVFAIGTAIFYFAEKYYSAAIVFLIFGVFYAFCFWSWRHRIPFSVLMLQTVIDVARTYGHVFMTSLVGGIIGMIFAAWWSITLVSVYVAYQPAQNGACQNQGGSCSKGKVIGMVVFVTFVGYWVTEFIKNVIHVSISGVYGSWYFSAGGSNAGSPPRHPTLGAFRRAITYSFGSIALGSLLVAIIQLLRQAASIVQSDAANSGDILQYVIFCLINCILSLVEWAIQFINQYAFSYIALYGEAYIPAAKKTWRLFKDRGIDALIQDCLIDPVLTMGATFVGYLGTLLAYLYLKFTNPAYNHDGAYTPVILAFSFLVCLQIGNIVLNPLKSGATAIFVAMAVNPEILQQDHPDLYQRMVSVYPKVQQVAHV